MRIFLLFFLFLFSLNGISQNVNDYKYAIVPAKFDFLKEKDKYRLNTLTKLLMEKYGFEAFLSSDVLPDKIAEYKCDKVYVEVIENNSLFVTRLSVQLKDCKNNVLFTSENGVSREKEYSVAYNEALRNAFKSFEKLNYKFKSEKTVDINHLTLKTDTSESIIEPKDSEQILNNIPDFFFTKPVTNGFQIINNESKVIMHIFFTSEKNVFIAFRDNIQGVAINKNNHLIFEYYKDSKLVTEHINLKF